MRMRTLALASAVAVSALALQPALAQTTTAPGQPGAPGAGTPPASPSASGAQPSTAAPAQPATPTKQMTVSALTDKDLVGARDNEVGDIERVVGVVESNADKKQYLVISRGGFLGLFETEVLVPLENVAAQGDRIVLRNLTEEQVKALPKYTTDDKAYRNLDGSQTVSLNELK
jgi:sporulation protein YlmC with PRC-barrel domain